MVFLQMSVMIDKYYFQFYLSDLEKEHMNKEPSQ